MSEIQIQQRGSEVWYNFDSDTVDITIRVRIAEKDWLFGFRCSRTQLLDSVQNHKAMTMGPDPTIHTMEVP